MAGYIPPPTTAADSELIAQYNLQWLRLFQLSPVLEPFDTGGGIILIPPPSPFLSHSTGSPWNRVSSRPDSATLSIASSAETVDIDIEALHGEGADIDARVDTVWSEVPLKDVSKIAPWDRSVNEINVDQGGEFNRPPDRDISRAAPWDDSVAPADKGLAADYLYAPPKDLARSIDHTTTRPHQAPLPTPDFVEGAVAELSAPYIHPDIGALDLVLKGQYIQPGTVKFQPPDPIRFYRPRDQKNAQVYGMVPSIDDATKYPWGRGQYYRRAADWGIAYPTYTGPVFKQDPPIPDIKLSYLTMNIVNVVKLPELTPVNLRDINISLDVDSWAWSMTGTVRGQSSLDVIKPTGAGPVDIQVTINGHEWIFMIESYTGTRAIADDVFSVRGSSRTQYLASPYAPKSSYTNGSSINAKQAVEDLLTGTGFTLEWISLGDEDTPDWNIPAGALAYTNKTPLEVIKWIADAAGAIVVPDLASDNIIIKPRYPTPPWQLAGATMDKVVVEAMVRSISEEWIPAALYNSAYVSGINAGRGTLVTRQGTAGDQPAPDMFSELQVALECNRGRGEQIIADSGNRSRVQMDLHIPESATAPGLILPGHEIEYQGASETWRGYVAAVSISASGPGAAPVWQNITVNRPLEH
ncbi:hypothetical protein N9J88_03400 [Porticoccaceae bacterium]|nr:hypothetical protein [Porticoccaceae bacterium]